MKVTLAGSAAGAPRLQLTEVISDDPDNALDSIDLEDQGNGQILNTVTPGQQMSFTLLAQNTGPNPAEDVYVRTHLPEGTQLVPAPGNPADVLNAVSFVGKSASTKPSRRTLRAALTDNGQYLVISGIHLEAGDYVALSYTVLFPTSGDNAPVPGTIILPGATTIGSSSVLATPEGTPGYIGIKVIGQTHLVADPRARVAEPKVTHDVNATATTLNAIFKIDTDADPYVANDPTRQLVPGFQRFYVDYRNDGSSDVGPATLSWPLPTHTAFYRASFVDKKGEFTGRKDALLAPPKDVSLKTPAFLSENGTLTASFGRVKKGATGTIMLEVLVKDTAISSKLAGNELTRPRFVAGTGLRVAARTEAQGVAAAESPIYRIQKATDPQLVPDLGLIKVAPNAVVPGEDFIVQLGVFNYGEKFASVFASIEVPEGCVFRDASAASNTGHPIAFLGRDSTTPGSRISTNLIQLAPHQAAALTFFFTVTGDVDGVIVEHTAKFEAEYFGELTARPTTTLIVNGNSAKGQQALGTTQTNVIGPWIQPQSGTVVIPLYPPENATNPQCLVSGPANIVSTTSNTIIANAGNVMIVGSTNGTQIKAVPARTATTASALFQDLLKLLADGGYVAAGPESRLLAPDGKTLLLTVGGKVIGQDGGGLIGQDGGGLIGNDGGGLIGNDGSGLIGNDGTGLFGVPLIANDGGTLIANDGGTLIANDGGTIQSPTIAGFARSAAANLQSARAATSARPHGYILTYGGGVIAAASDQSVGGKKSPVSISPASSTATIIARDGNVVTGGGGQFYPRANP